MNQNLYIYFLSIISIAFIACNSEEMKSIDFSLEVDSTKINRKVLIIGVDGFRSDGMQFSLTPFLYEFSLRNTTFYNNRHLIEDLTHSGPNWSSILTGVRWSKHQVTTNEFENNNLVEYPHLFKYIELADSSIKTVSIVNWTPINEHIASPYSDYAPTYKCTDLEVYQHAVNLLSVENGIYPDILFLHFLDLDYTGHGFGFNPNVMQYANKLTTFDSYVNHLVAIIETKRLEGEDWIIFIISDHGGEEKFHNNGFGYDNIKYTIFYVNHPEVKFLKTKQSSQVDLAPTVLDFLGIKSGEFNYKTDGISLITEIY